MYSMRTFLSFVLAGTSTLAIAQKYAPCSKVISRTEMKSHTIASESTDAQVYASEGAGKFKKYVSYNDDSGALFLKYEFVKNNEEYIYEKTVNATGKSKEERQQIILEFENEIAFPGRKIHINL